VCDAGGMRPDDDDVVVAFAVEDVGASAEGAAVPSSAFRFLAVRQDWWEVDR
jgi:hypothetical protein